MRRPFVCLALLITLIESATFQPAFAQLASQSELSPGYYVVVGAYARSRGNIAQNYTETLRMRGHQAEFGFNASRNMYFVYLRYFETLKEALSEMTSIRKTAEFKGAWVRVVPGVITGKAVPHKQETKAVVTAKPEEKKQDETSTPTDTTAAAEEDWNVTDNPPIIQYNPMTLGNTEVFLSLFNKGKNQIIDGEIEVIDKDRSRTITKVKGNEYLMLPDPKSKTGQIVLVCDIFGYKKVTQEINYPLPLGDTIKSYVDLMGTTLVVNFNMERYSKGEMGTLYNVIFHNDAAIMLPDSKKELNGLLAFMQESNSRRIRLHGHTNGNYNGKLITVGPDKNFFSMEGAVTGVGSSKDLSFKRAEVIKEYLIANGIAADRIEIKAWGGKKPLYDKMSVNAKKNVRVEVEVLAD